ncbi:hypothetical protein N7468_006156 [Penicillium chermesinum]|uniref:Uncharacterized protein n=1 Tax=Penicillium chermesinum TaxID=63820 RepID=A0A9W9TJC6_9EURO|nr:uncharacterized protein N7468_006156 [Penicillium chermesinum]KAJ5224931.1 hypothetical protein N7468_006156 [Penicillium chermesinum]
MGPHSKTYLVRAIICLVSLGLLYISTSTSPQALSKRSFVDQDLQLVSNRSEWHFLERRAGLSWGEAVQKGEKYLANLQGACGDSKATLPELQSEWTEKAYSGETLTAKSLPEVFQALGLDTKIGKKVKSSYWIQDKSYGEDQTPRYAGKSAKLKKNLKYFFRYHIENPETRAIIDQATDNNIQPYPGTNFPIESEQGKALLGTPNGRAVPFFLSTHKGFFGEKMIKSVKIFKTIEEDLEWYNMMFFIDVEPTDGSSGV